MGIKIVADAEFNTNTNTKSNPMRSILVAIAFMMLVMAGCKPKPEATTALNEKLWGQVGDKVVYLFTLTNKNGMELKITNYGGIITSVAVPDKNGVYENVVLGFDSLKTYQAGHPYFGSLVGRYGNRIAKGKFVLHDTTYTLAVNNGENHLHGGLKGFDSQVFTVDTAYSSQDSVVLALSYLSRDMEEGYPGNLLVKVWYVLTANNEIKIRYKAETDRLTVLNLTNHSYFNLTGCRENVLNHEVVLLADSITPTDTTLIPTGVLAPVAGTPFDFTSAHAIGERIGDVPGGYDINYKLRNITGQLVQAAEVYEPVSGRVLEAFTTEPGVQFYTGNFLDGSLTGSGGVKYEKHYGFCLEAQHFPDSPNQPQFPTVILNPGEKYRQLTVYRFSTR
jgi:aldose 1-epimerase